MLSRLPLLGIIFGAGLAAAASAQTARESYLQDCLTGVGLQTLPSFECSDGVPLETSMFGQDCDAMAHLPDHGCAAGSRLGRLPLPDADVLGVYVCRKYEDELADSSYGITLENNQYSDIGLILHNTHNGKTCFFQSDVPNILDGSITPAELLTSAWREPARQAMCTECHASDAFLVTPYVVKEFLQLGLMHSNPRGPYVVVGGSADDTRSRDYGALTTAATISQEEGCAGACHFMPGGGAGHEFYDYFVEDALDLGWMPAFHGSYWTTDLILEEDAEAEQLQYFHNAGSHPWLRTGGATPTWGTGPTGPAAGSSQYFYFETSRGHADRPGDTAILESQWLDSRHARLTFDYHIHGADIGSLHVDVWTDEQWRNNIWARLGGGDAEWRRATVDLGHYGGELIKLRIRARAAGGSLGDIAIDNIEVRRTR